LARNFDLLPWLGTSKLLHQDLRGQFESHHQASVCGSHSQSRQGNSHPDHESKRRAWNQGQDYCGFGSVGTKYQFYFQKINHLSTTDLTKVLERTVEALSGGELQRFAIAVVAVQEADM